MSTTLFDSLESCGFPPWKALNDNDLRGTVHGMAARKPAEKTSAVAKLLGANLAAIVRVHFDGNQRKAAEKFDITEGFLSKVLRGKPVSMDVIDSIAAGTGYSYAVLMSPDLADSLGQVIGTEDNAAASRGVPSPVTASHGKTSSTHATSRKASSHADPSLPGSTLTLGDLEGLHVKLRAANGTVADAVTYIGELLKQARLAQSRPPRRRGNSGHAH